MKLICKICRIFIEGIEEYATFEWEQYKLRREK